MNMLGRILTLLILLASSSVVFASGNLTIYGTDMAPTYGNANSQIRMLNLSLNVTAGDGTINLSVINFTIVAGVGNVTAIEIFNSSLSSIASSSSFNSTTNKTTVTFSSGLFVNTTLNATIIVALNLSTSATRLNTISVNISSVSDIRTTNSFDNISISGSSIQSGNTQMQSVQANASISPRFIDTSIENQTLVYTITPTGTDNIQNISIIVPVGYSIVSLVNVLEGGSLLASGNYVNVTTTNMINISLAASTPLELKINFTVNSNASSINALPFNSTITGGNFSNTNTTPINTSVKTSQLIGVNTVSITKGAAIVNGTDYWEFTYSINVTENISTGGFVQFKMADWNNSAGQAMQLTNGTDYYSSLRLSTDVNNTFNVTNNYNISKGISFSSVTSSNPVSLILKMIIPASTPISASWFTTYNMIFRSFS